MLSRQRPPIGARGVMQMRVGKGPMGLEARAARREAGSEARAANGREEAWRCREEEAGGGAGLPGLRPLARAGWDAAGGHGGNVRENGNKG